MLKTSNEKARMFVWLAKTMVCFGVSLLCLLNSGVAKAGQSVSISQPGIRLQCKQWNKVDILNEKGKLLVTFKGFGVKWKPSYNAEGGTFKKVTSEDGRPGLEVTYATNDKSKEKPCEIVGRFMLIPGGVDISYDVLNVRAEEKINVGGCMIDRVFPKNIKKDETTKLGLWTRDENGGVPYQVKDGVLVKYAGGASDFYFAFTKENTPNMNWWYDWNQHIGMKELEPGHYKGTLTIMVAPSGWAPEAIMSRWQKRPLGVSLSTEKLYNWWDDKSKPLSTVADIVNTSEKKKSVEIKSWARSFDGSIVWQKAKTVELKSGQKYIENISFKSKNDRDIFFVEVSATDKETGKEFFARTNLAMLPPHEFKSTTDDSIFGIAAYWPFPNKEAVQKIMDRMGIRWVRHGDTREQNPGRLALHHSNIRWNKEYTAQEQEEWITKQLEKCIENKNSRWEFANEINMSTAGIAMEGWGIGKALLAEKYDNWVRAIRRIQKEKGLTQVKLLSFGIAGMDTVFVKRMHELGTWELLDGMCLHPGRGNYTPDFPVSIPQEEWVVGKNGNYWNYYGSVKTAMSLIKKYGGNKELWLTEVYTPTFPNSFWEDTPRHATENVVLSYALAKAEGVKGGMYYQMFDTVWWDRLGVNHKDREYYFGLIQRDMSFKPTVLAYCTIAEALDQAKFGGWLNFSNESKNKGLWFDTPRGKMAIIWNRADGYILTEKKDPFPTPEPWIDLWKTKTSLELPAASDNVTVINCIGQKNIVKADVGGKAKITVDGAAKIIYGLDISKLK